VLDDSGGAAGRRSRAARPAARHSGRAGRSAERAPSFAGPYVSAGPYEREDGTRYEIRLERVPGGVRVASWSGGSLERRAPEVRADDLVALVDAARARNLLPAGDADALAEAVAAAGDAAPGGIAGASPGRAGDMREELRVEARGDGMLRIARWLLFPSRGWELQEAAPMLPARRYAEALRALFSAASA